MPWHWSYSTSLRLFHLLRQANLPSYCCIPTTWLDLSLISHGLLICHTGIWITRRTCQLGLSSRLLYDACIYQAVQWEVANVKGRRCLHRIYNLLVLFFSTMMGPTWTSLRSMVTRWSPASSSLLVSLLCLIFSRALAQPSSSRTQWPSRNHPTSHPHMVTSIYGLSQVCMLIHC